MRKLLSNMSLPAKLSPRHAPQCIVNTPVLHRLSVSRFARHSGHTSQQAHSFRNSAALFRKRHHCTVAAGKTAAAAGPQSAKDAVEEGLQAFHERRDAAAALSLFERALELSPTEEEARAAMYNSACAHTKLRQWKQAADAAVLAINKYGEPLSTAIKVSARRHLLTELRTAG